MFNNDNRMTEENENGAVTQPFASMVECHILNTISVSFQCAFIFTRLIIPHLHAATQQYYNDKHHQWDIKTSSALQTFLFHTFLSINAECTHRISHMGYQDIHISKTYTPISYFLVNTSCLHTWDITHWISTHPLHTLLFHTSLLIHAVCYCWTNDEQNYSRCVNPSRKNEYANAH